MIYALALSPVRSPFAPLFFQGDLDTGLERAAEYGYEAVELSLGDAADVDPARLKRRLADLNLRVSAVATGQLYYRRGLSLLDPDADGRARCQTELKGIMDVAADVGSSFLVIGGVRGRWPEPGRAPEGEARRWLEAGLAEVAAAAEGRGMGVLVEPINRYETDCIRTVAEALDVVRAVGADNVGLLVDTFHATLEEASPAAAFIEAGDRLHYVHVADSNRRIPGSGTVAFPTVFSVLRQLNYRGPIGVEALPDPNSEEAAAGAIRFCRHLQRFS